MPSYQYNHYHYKDKVAMRPFHLCNGNTYAWKDDLYIETWPSSLFHLVTVIVSANYGVRIIEELRYTVHAMPCSAAAVR